MGKSLVAFLIVIVVLKVIASIGTIDMLIGAHGRDRVWKWVALVVDSALCFWAGWLLSAVWGKA